MKSLDQIEPRINLQNAPASVVTTSDATYHYIINQPGSYYLSGNIVATKARAIKIGASDVTLDLRGFRISTSVAGTTVGVDVVGQQRATIRNGTVTGFAYGIGADANSHACAIHDVALTGCTFRAIIAAGNGGLIDSCRFYGNSGESCINSGPGAIVSNCAAYSNNLTFAAIYVHAGSSVINCNVQATAGSAGFIADSGCTFTNCMANGSGNSGFRIADGTTMFNCIANGNSADGITLTADKCNISNCIVSNNTGAGINALAKTSVLNSTATDNGTDGIKTGDNSTVSQCNASGNLQNGIKTGNNSTVSTCGANGNTSTDRQSGIGIGSGGVVSNCSASSNHNGITVDAGSTVRHCDVRANHFNGIQILTNGNSIIENEADLNGTGEFGAGIYVSNNTSVANRIDGNHCSYNLHDGIIAVGTNVVTRNFVTGSGVQNFDTGSTPSAAEGAIFNMIGCTGSCTIPNTAGPYSNVQY